MMVDQQPAFTGRMDGRIHVYLTANKFRVELSDGQLVDAAMPDELIEEIRPYYTGDSIAVYIGVVVEFRSQPAMHRIVEINHPGAWFGVPRVGIR